VEPDKGKSIFKIIEIYLISKYIIPEKGEKTYL